MGASKKKKINRRRSTNVFLTLTKSFSLKLLHIITSGVDHIASQPIVTETDIAITSSSGIHGPPIAEWVVMNWIVASRHYNLTYKWQKEHYWAEKSNHFNVQDHAGKRLGVLGYGSIGRQSTLSVKEVHPYLSYRKANLPT